MTRRRRLAEPESADVGISGEEIQRRRLRLESAYEAGQPELSQPVIEYAEYCRLVASFLEANAEPTQRCETGEDGGMVLGRIKYQSDRPSAEGRPQIKT